MGNIKEALDEYTDAFNSHDEQRIKACYTDDAVFTGRAASASKALTRS